MQLTRYTDYGLRVLMYLAAKKDAATVSEIATRFGISRNHLVKVAHRLGQLGYIETARGKAGGLRLAHTPEAINVASVVRDLEPNFTLVECFSTHGQCPITPACALRGVLAKAHEAFMEALAAHTIADLTRNGDELMRLLEQAAKGRA